MERTELPAFLESRLDFPVGVDAVRAEIGTVEIEAPDSADSVTIDSLLEDLGEDSYESAAMLDRMLSGQLPDEFVGRKFYDDRGPNVDEDSPRDTENQSF